MSIMLCLLPHVCLVPLEGTECPGTRVTDKCEPRGGGGNHLRPSAIADSALNCPAIAPTLVLVLNMVREI